MTTQKYLYYLLGIVAAVTVVVIAMTGLQEVADRKHETGIMIAMGVSHMYIVCLYLVKTLCLALAAAVMGFLLGSALAVHFTSPFLVVITRPVTILLVTHDENLLQLGNRTVRLQAGRLFD